MDYIEHKFRLAHRPTQQNRRPDNRANGIKQLKVNVIRRIFRVKSDAKKVGDS